MPWWLLVQTRSVVATPGWTTIAGWWPTSGTTGASDLEACPGAVGERRAFDRLIQPQDCYVTDRVPRFVILHVDLRLSLIHISEPTRPY